MRFEHFSGGGGEPATMEPGPMGLSDIGAVGREYPQFGKSVWNVGRCRTDVCGATPFRSSAGAGECGCGSGRSEEGGLPVIPGFGRTPDGGEQGGEPTTEVGDEEPRPGGATGGGEYGDQCCCPTGAVVTQAWTIDREPTIFRGKVMRKLNGEILFTYPPGYQRWGRVDIRLIWKYLPSDYGELDCFILVWEASPSAPSGFAGWNPRGWNFRPEASTSTKRNSNTELMSDYPKVSIGNYFYQFGVLTSGCPRCQDVCWLVEGVSTKSGMKFRAASGVGAECSLPPIGAGAEIPGPGLPGGAPASPRPVGALFGQLSPVRTNPLRYKSR